MKRIISSLTLAMTFAAFMQEFKDWDDSLLKSIQASTLIVAGDTERSQTRALRGDVSFNSSLSADDHPGRAWEIYG